MVSRSGNLQSATKNFIQRQSLFSRRARDSRGKVDIFTRGLYIASVMTWEMRDGLNSEFGSHDGLATKKELVDPATEFASREAELQAHETAKSFKLLKARNTHEHKQSQVQQHYKALVKTVGKRRPL